VDQVGVDMVEYVDDSAIDVREGKAIEMSAMWQERVDCLNAFDAFEHVTERVRTHLNVFGESAQNSVGN
jgi:hypothetical protein